MKCLLPICAVVLMAVPATEAQLVSSHSSAAKPAATTSASMVPVARPTGKTVVTVNGTALTDRDLLREMFQLFPYAKLHNGFPKSEEKEIRRGAMDMIVFEELVYQDALKRKISVPPTKLEKAKDNFMSQFGNRAQFDAFLKQEMNGSTQKLDRTIRRSVLIEALLKLEVEDKSAVSSIEARAYYDKNKKEYTHGEQYLLQTISILPPPNANPQTVEESRKHAEEILKKAKATNSYADFGKLAEQYSEDDFHVNMGDHRAVNVEAMPLEVKRAAASLKNGGVSDLIQLGNSFTIFRINGHRVAGVEEFEDVKPRLMEKLRKLKYERLRRELGERVRKGAQIQQVS